MHLSKFITVTFALGGCAVSTGTRDSGVYPRSQDISDQDFVNFLKHFEMDISKYLHQTVPAQPAQPAKPVRGPHRRSQSDGTPDIAGFIEDVKDSAVKRLGLPALPAVPELPKLPGA